MRKEVLEAMDDEELNLYANIVKADIKGVKSRDAKVAKILEARERTVEIKLFGETFSVPLRAARDQRVADLLNQNPCPDENVQEAEKLLLGDEQYEKLIALCTDDDGTIDGPAIGMAAVMLLRSGQVKN